MHSIHRAWLVCAGAMLMMFVSTGLLVNTLTVYMPYLLAAYDMTNAQGSLINTIRCLASLVSMLFVERYYRKVGVRRGAVLAMALCAVSYFLYGLCRSFIQFCMVAVIGGVAYSLGGIVAVTIVIDAWFVDRKGAAMGICTAGSGFAMVLLPPVLTNLLEHRGIPITFFAEAALMLVLTVVIGIALGGDCPEQMDLEPYRAANGAAETGGERPKGGTMSRGGLVVMLVAMAFIGSVGGPGYNHLTVLYTSFGYDSMTVAFGMSLIGGMLIVGKCVFGLITDRIGAYRTNYLFGGVLIVGFVVCCMTVMCRTGLLFAAQFCLGLGMSICTVGLPVWAGDLSDPERHSRTVQQFQTAYSAGALVFSPLPGVLADLTGSYLPSYILFTVQSVAILAILQGMYRRCACLEKIH